MIKETRKLIIFSFIFAFFFLTNLAHLQATESGQYNWSKILNGSKGLYNFGVVVNNNKFQIYRSRRLGKNGVKELFDHLDLIGLEKPSTIIYMNYTNYSKYNKHTIEEYELQQELGYNFLHSYDYSYRTYLDGHNPFYPERDIDDLKSISFWNKPTKKAIKLFDIHPDGIIDGGIEAFKRIISAVLDNKAQPVLFHCYGGKHRTGIIALAIRYIQGGEWTEPRTTIAFPAGAPFGKDVIINNDAKMEYMLYNSSKPRQDNFDFIDSYSKTPHFKKLIKNYRAYLNE